MEIDEFGDGEWVLLLEVADKLDDAAESGQDCLSTLCTLSGVGGWIVVDGRDVYSAPGDDAICQRVAERE